MPAKSGASHAGAAFLSIVLGALISNVLSAHAGLLGDFVEGVGSLVASVPVISLSKDVTGLLVVSTLLAFLWGVAFHYSEHSPTGSGTDNADEPLPEETIQLSTTDTRQTGDTGDDPAQVSQVDPETYRSTQTAQRAEQQLRARLERDLEDVTSRCDDIHDRLYDAGKRDDASRVQSIQDTLTQIKRTVKQASDVHPVPVEAGRPGSAPDKLDDRTKTELATTHTDLVETSDELVGVVRNAHYAADVDAEVLDTCDRLAGELERALDSRRTVVQQLGEHA
jgi:hypothetical protein